MPCVRVIPPFLKQPGMSLQQILSLICLGPSPGISQREQGKWI